jgi:hypothetical protein
MCNCGGKRGTPRQFRKRASTPTIGPQSIQGGTAAGPSPAQLRALGMQKAISPKSAKRLDEDRRKLEKVRREAIRRRLNK